MDWAAYRNEFDMTRLLARASSLFAVLTLACTGQLTDSAGAVGSGSEEPGGGATGGLGAGGPGPDFAGDPSLPARSLASISGLRRLTVHEYDNTVRDLMGDDSRQGALLLPEDLKTPFDNDYTIQVASKALVEGAELLAQDIARRWLENATTRQQLLGCTPSDAGDAVCFERFIRSFGRRALRRPLDEVEISRYLALLTYGVERNDFYVAVDTALRAFLQDPNFLYRVELGSPLADDPSLLRLNGFELASRLSYLLWGSAPDEPLLEAAAAGLSTFEAVRAEARNLLEDPRARQAVARFHALWLGYESLPHPAQLSADMKQESTALISRVVFEEGRPWQDIFRVRETYATKTLAEHYGLTPAAGEAGWVAYPDAGRQGLLSHGSFLSVGAKFADTSPTLRGLAIRTRLFCQEILPPPPSVNADVPPEATAEGQCKEERYRVHGQGGCAGCHALMDPVGFGLEQYDQMGRFRTHDADNVACEIRGAGELVGVGTFKGPAELSSLMLTSGLINECVTKQLFRFATGRAHLDAVDDQLVQALSAKVAGPVGDFRFDDLVVDLVSSEAFMYRKEEP